VWGFLAIAIKIHFNFVCIKLVIKMSVTTGIYGNIVYTWIVRLGHKYQSGYLCSITFKENTLGFIGVAGY
jgi:hypothetical protein